MKSTTYAIALFIGLIVSSHAERLLPPQDINSQIAAAHATAIEAERQLNCLGKLGSHLDDGVIRSETWKTSCSDVTDPIRNKYRDKSSRYNEVSRLSRLYKYEVEKYYILERNLRDGIK